MANVNRFDKLGRIWIKNYFDGHVDDGLQSDSGQESVLMFKMFPAMTIPHRMWLSWRIFSDPGTQIDPHVQHELKLSFRAANIDLNHNATNWNGYDAIHALTERYMPIADAQFGSETGVADDVDFYGGQTRTALGKRSEIFNKPYEYMMGLPNHAMLIAGSHIMMHCVGQASTDKNRGMVIPASVDITKPYVIGLMMSRKQPAAGTGDDAMDTTLEHSISGNTTPDALYEDLVQAIPFPVGDNVDYEIGPTDLNAAVKDWQTRGWAMPGHSFAGSNMPNLHYAVRFTAETSIYTDKQSKTITAP